MTDDDWSDALAAWWLDEIASDDAYRRDVVPMAMDLLAPQEGRSYIDLGCGEGGLMRAIKAAGSRVVGLDASRVLAREARSVAPVVVARLPEAACLRDDAVDGAVLCLVLDHLEEARTMFATAARVVRPGGVLVVVANHPLITAAGSGPLVDIEDGEVLWRWGGYLSRGHTEHSVAGDPVRFHHHPLGILLTSAAAAGWSLERAVERAITPPDDPILGVQGDIPRLLGLRWRRLAAPPT